MGNSTFSPFEFQKCTAAWAIERLFGKTHRAPSGRVLIADEVGLGKTIVTKQICDRLRTLYPRKDIQIVYMTSSLDICRQNRRKLSHSKAELVTADRITLLYAFKRIDSKARVTIFSMTPGTSLQIGNSAGNNSERVYIAWLAQKLFRFNKAQASRVFALEASAGFPKRYCQSTFDTYQRLPRDYWRPLKESWRNIVVGGRKIEEVIHDRKVTAPIARAIVKALRRALVEVLLKHFRPELIVLDEFQRFHKDLLEVNEHGGLKDPLAARFLKPSTPTLLLSATPYRLWDDGNQAKPGELPHHEDLQRTFAFLLNSQSAAADLMKNLDDFGKKLLNLNGDTFADFYRQKKSVEKIMKQVMVRTERVNFIEKNTAVTLPQFMSDAPDPIMDEELYEYLALSGASQSRQTLLSYWKSGASLLSYMQNYQIRDEWLADRQSRNDSTLWARFGKSQIRNVKLRYILRDIFGQDCEKFSYLWVPPTHTYYAGKGIFEPKRLASLQVKKGLIFSTWKFVPRMIAAELSHRRQFRYRRVTPKTNPLRATPVTWARFYFPSRLLAGSLRHTDFVEAGTYKKLLAKACSNIRVELKRLGILVRPRATGKPWQVLRYADFQTRGALRPALDAYKKQYHQSSLKSKRKGRSFEDRYLDVWDAYETKPTVSSKTVTALGRMAISSPSVCLLRALELLHGELSMESLEWRVLLEHCIHDIRNYLNRSINQEVISSSFPKGSYASRVEAYLTAGNYQALLDEYLSLCDVGSEHSPILDSIEILRTVIGGSAGSVTLPINARGRPTRVATDVAIAFGEGHEDSGSRDSARVGFNSPFWPMVLATTSVGQEGLDFHLFCKDVYHWNLPSSPVAFEQREGRINRFNGLMVRKNLVANQPKPVVREGENLWEQYFKESPKYCIANDRYNMGLSPHWIYTSKKTSRETAFQRHVLDLPYSSDRRRYELLMTDLTNYRLALGQPDQIEFLKKVKDNPYLAAADPRNITLNLFPVEHREPFAVSLEDFPLKSLIQDVRTYVGSMTDRQRKRQLKSAAEQCIGHLEELLTSPNERRAALSKKAMYVVAALRYFVDPHDANNDRIPENRFDHDLKAMKEASAIWRKNS